MNFLDRIFAKLTNRSLFFRKGWGDMAVLEHLSRQEFHITAVPDIRIQWSPAWSTPEAFIQEGSFESPADERILLPPESSTAYVQFVRPRDRERFPVCLHFAATGDQGFRRRRETMALPLARRGIGAMILNNPYYGRRRPGDQEGVYLQRVVDLWNMALATVKEGLALLEWLRGEGYGSLGVSGISMGGHMAVLTGVQYRRPLAIAPCLPPHSGSAVFTEGLLKRYCDWETLGASFSGERQALEFMRTLLDSTDLRRFPAPVEPGAAVLVAAKRDDYISAESTRLLHGHWPGSELRWLNTGHVGSFLFYRKHFLRAVVDAFSRLDGAGDL